MLDDLPIAGIVVFRELYMLRVARLSARLCPSTGHRTSCSLTGRARGEGVSCTEKASRKCRRRNDATGRC